MEPAVKKESAGRRPPRPRPTVGEPNERQDRGLRLAQLLGPAWVDIARQGASRAPVVAEAVRLIEAGFEAVEPSIPSKAPPIVVAARWRRDGLGDVFLALTRALRGADALNAPDRHGLSALHCCAEVGDAEGVERLVWAGAALDARDARGWTPLMAASGAGQCACVRLLLAAGADRGARSPRGESAESLACGLGRGDPREVALARAAALQAALAAGEAILLDLHLSAQQGLPAPAGQRRPRL